MVTIVDGSSIIEGVKDILSKTVVVELANPPKAVLTLFDKLKMIAAFERNIMGRSIIEADVLGILEGCVMEILLDSPHTLAFAAVRVGNKIGFNLKQVRTVSRELYAFLKDETKMSTLKLVCSTAEGRSRVRLPGGGRRRDIPAIIDNLVYHRMNRYTLFDGGFSNVDLMRAVKELVGSRDGIRVLLPGDSDPGSIDVPEDKRTIRLHKVWCFRWRTRWGVKSFNGSHQTSIDPFEALERMLPCISKVWLLRAITGCSIDDMQNEDQSMIFIYRANTQKRYKGQTGKAGHKSKESMGRSTFTICLTVRGSRISLVSIIFECIGQDKVPGTFTKHALSELDAVGLKPGLTKGDDDDPDIFIGAAPNGWMQEYHLEDLAKAQAHDRPNWCVMTHDNWFGFERSAHRKRLQQQRVAQVLVPPRLSSIANLLDLKLNAYIKRDQAIDRTKDSMDATLRHYFETKTGRKKAGSQYLTAKRIIERTRSLYNSDQYADGYIRDWKRIGISHHPIRMKLYVYLCQVSVSHLTGLTINFSLST